MLLPDPYFAQPLNASFPDDVNVLHWRVICLLDPQGAPNRDEDCVGVLADLHKVLKIDCVVVLLFVEFDKSRIASKFGVGKRLCVAVPFPGLVQISVRTKEPKRLMETARVVHSLLENSVPVKTIASM